MSISKIYKKQNLEESLVYEETLYDYLTFDIAEKYADHMPKVTLVKNGITNYFPLSPLYKCQLDDPEELKLLPIHSWEQINELYNR